MPDETQRRRGVDLPALRTPRLLLRRMTPQDAAALAAYRSDPEVARYQSWEPPVTVEQARRMLEEAALVPAGTVGSWTQVGVVDATTGAVLGDVAVLVDDDGRQARIGFTLAPTAQGHGYATEAVTALLDHLVDQGVHRISADCDVRNAPSWALLERVGLRREAHHRASAWWKGEWTDEYVYAVLAQEWPRRRPPLPPPTPVTA